MEEKKSSNIWFGICFLIWFVLSMAGIIIFSSLENTPAVLMLFGQYFLVFGIMIIISKGGSVPVGLLFTLVGVAIVALTFLKNWGPEFGIYIETEAIVMYAIPALFVLIGGGITWSSVNKRVRLKTNCDTEVQGECVEVKSKWSRLKKGGRKELYMPVFLFEYNSEKFLVETGVYSNVGVVNKGEIVTLHINSSKPKEFYSDSMLKAYFIPIIVGIIFMVAGVFVLAMMIIGG